MFDAKKLFTSRLKKHIQLISRYSKYILNSHIAFALFFFVSVFSVFYQQWLQSLPDSFPTAIIISILFSFLVNYQPIRTFLEEADIVFLLKAEKKMHAYFCRSLLYSYLMQVYVILLIGAALAPLYFATYPDSTAKTYSLLLITVFILKLSSLFMNWWSFKESNSNHKLAQLLIRYLLAITIFWSLLDGEMMWAAILTVVWAAMFLYLYKRYMKVSYIPWLALIENDQQSLYSFYKLANLFTDVPQVQTVMRRRAFIVKLFVRKTYRATDPLSKLYQLTFIRSGNYFNMFVRLTIVGAIFVYGLPIGWLKLCVALLFIYISNLQLSTIYNEHKQIAWLTIYPIQRATEIKAIQKILTTTTSIQLLVFASISLIVGEATIALVILIGLGLFSYYFIFHYLSQRLIQNR